MNELDFIEIFVLKQSYNSLIETEEPELKALKYKEYAKLLIELSMKHKVQPYQLVHLAGIERASL